MEKYILSCDWGTSSFRLRLYNLSEQHIVGEVVSGNGIANMNRDWLEQVAQNVSITKAALFRRYLKKQVELLSNKVSVNVDNVTILISGMASSSIGMYDIPYATAPFVLDGSEAIIKRFDAVDEFPHEIILISGVRSENDVMRGEETQLIGLLSLLEQTGSKVEGVFIFPGTHSKHIVAQDGQLVTFKTFMTGELFNIMCNHSILKDSVQTADIDVSGKDAAFKQGVRESQTASILNSLFTVRTNQLFNKLDKKQNGFYLSGLLIGEEIKSLLKKQELPLFLCSGSNLYQYYKLAFDELNLSERTTIVPFDMIDTSALEGQKIIFQKHVLNRVAND